MGDFLAVTKTEGTDVYGRRLIEYQGEGSRWRYRIEADVVTWSWAEMNHPSLDLGGPEQHVVWRVSRVGTNAWELDVFYDIEDAMFIARSLAKRKSAK